MVGYINVHHKWVGKSGRCNNAPVNGNPSPHGAWDNCWRVAELNCCVLTSVLSPLCHGTAGILIPCPDWPWKFCICVSWFEWGFWKGLRRFDHKNVPAVLGVYPGFAKIKVNILAIPQPWKTWKTHGYKWLVHVRLIIDIYDLSSIAPDLVTPPPFGCLFIDFYGNEISHYNGGLLAYWPGRSEGWMKAYTWQPVWNHCELEGSHWQPIINLFIHIYLQVNFFFFFLLSVGSGNRDIKPVVNWDKRVMRKPAFYIHTAAR